MMSNRLLLLFAVLLASVGSRAQMPEFFQPYAQTALRLPAVPIFVNDPYFSIWSSADQLNDETVCHWTGAEKPIEGLLRVDGTTYRFMGINDTDPQIGIQKAKQRGCQVMATNTYFTFECGPVMLDLVFTAPLLVEDLNILSAPINYISYRVRTRDGRLHKAQFFLSVSPLIAMNEPDKPCVSSYAIHRGVKYMKTGTLDQPILARKGDNVCIDWGHFYFPDFNGEVSIGKDMDLKKSFVEDGTLPQGENRVVARSQKEHPTLAYVHDFGTVEEGNSFCLVGYDEEEDVEYMYRRYRGYWTQDGRFSIFDLFRDMGRDYATIMIKCRQLDQRIYDDGFHAGGVRYAELLSGAYRQVMAAHKLFRDHDGNTIYFSKENNSSGFVNTVDVTYPSAPLFLCYNTELLKGMMTSIFDYSKSGRWTKPYPAHDLGTYPIANGQASGDDMPIEEAGSMVILATMVSKLESNTAYADRYWDIITTWTDYLVKNGLRPERQQSTDGFMGIIEGNSNLVVKAIMAVAGYAEMARMKGLSDQAAAYLQKAKGMAETWEQETRQKDHYTLSYGSAPETWSMKYNMVWDKLWGLNILPNNVIQTELKYYLSKQKHYGLPLDSRKDCTKSDWILWTAAMASDSKTFNKLLEPVYHYVNETPSRVPISDWHDTVEGTRMGFKAHSVLGGYWMKVLMDKVRLQKK